MDIMHRKAGAGDAVGKGRWSGVRHLEKYAYLLVESPVKKAFLSTIQADLSCKPQISFADSSNSQSVMPGCIRPRSIQGPDKGDRHSFPIEMMYTSQNYRMRDFRKLQTPPIIRKITLRELHISFFIQ